MSHQMLPMLDVEKFLANQPPGDVVSCGNRKDLFKKQRRHWMESMGLDMCYDGHGTYGPALVSVCVRCGTGRWSNIQLKEEPK